MEFATMIASLIGGLAAIGYFYERAKARADPVERLRKQAKKRGLPQQIASDSSAETLKVFVNREPMWEYRLFEGFLSDELDTVKPKRLDLLYGKPGHDMRILDFRDSLRAVRGYSKSIQRMIGILITLVEEALPKALAPQDIASDIEMLFDTSRRFGDLYEKSLDCAIEMRTVNAPPEIERLMMMLSEAAVLICDKIEEIRDRLFYELTLLERFTPEELDGHKVRIVVSFEFDLMPINEGIQKLHESVLAQTQAQG